MNGVSDFVNALKNRKNLLAPGSDANNNAGPGGSGAANIIGSKSGLGGINGVKNTDDLIPYDSIEVRIKSINQILEQMLHLQRKF